MYATHDPTIVRRLARERATAYRLRAERRRAVREALRTRERPGRPTGFVLTVSVRRPWFKFEPAGPAV